MSGIAQQRSSSAPVAGAADGSITTNATRDTHNNELKKPVQKRSVDYVLRSGLAGGLAGCAVSAWKKD